MLVQARVAKTFEEGRKMLVECVKDGSAFNKFLEMVQAQGGDISYVLHPEKFPLAKHIIPILANEDGYVKEINALEIGLSSMQLGGGRETLEDVIDMSAGIILEKKVGDTVKKGDVLCYLHTNKEGDIVSHVTENVQNAYVLTKDYVVKPRVVLEVID